jgi:hypothetical protein
MRIARVAILVAVLCPMLIGLDGCKKKKHDNNQGGGNNPAATVCSGATCSARCM